MRLRSHQCQTSALEAESDADSDSGFMPPLPSRRRRKLFPLSAEEAFAAANKAKAAASAAAALDDKAGWPTIDWDAEQYLHVRQICS